MTYEIRFGGDVQLFDTVPAGIEACKALAREGAEVELIHSETEVVIYVTNVKAEQGGYFDPWTRVEVPKHAAPHYQGWVTAYTRKRIGATVYRNLAQRAWRVYDGRTGNYQDVANTTESRHLLTEMRLGKHL